MTFRNILLSTDLSEDSRRAHAHALRMARAFGAKVTLLHVNESSLFDHHGSKALLDYLETVGHSVARALEAEADLLSAEGIDVAVETAEGAASSQILEVARHLDADLIVLTKHGSQGVRALMGSTSKRVLRRSKRPVLAVHSHPEPLVGANYRRVLCTTDFSTDSERGLELALSLADTLDVPLDLLHVLALPVMVPVLPGEPPLSIPREMIDKDRGTREKTLRKRVHEIGSDRVDYRLTVSGDIPQAIVDDVRSSGADLLVMPSHGKGTLESMLIGSTTQDVVGLCPVPVLVAPREWLEARS